MKLFKIINKTLKYYLPSKYTFKYKVVCFLNLIGDLLELVGISFFPIIIYNIFKPEELEKFLHSKNIFFLDNFLNNENSIIIIVGSLVIFFLLKNIYLVVTFYFQKKLMIDIERTQRAQIYDRYLNKIEYEDYLKKNPSHLYSLIDRGVPETTTILDQILILIREIFLISIIVISTYFINAYATIITLTCLILFVLIFSLFTSKMSRWRGKIEWLYKIKNTKIVNETFDLIKEIRLYNKNKYFFDKFKYQTYISGRNKLFQALLNYLPRYLLEVGLILIVFLVICFSFYFFGNINEIMPFVTFIAASSIRLIPAFRLGSTAINHLNYKSNFLNAIIDELDLMKNNDNIDKVSISNEKAKSIKFQDKFTISKLKFKYENSSQETLNINYLEIKKGEKIGIVGVSGSGKSTLINIILGFLKPSEGKITVDGDDIKNNFLNWSKNIGYVPQETFFLDDKINKNIAIGVDEKDIDYQKLKNSIDVSNLTDFINKSNDGVETIIGNKALKISGGQRQRIGIARAVYNSPEILILDEATNSLDEENEIEIINDVLAIKNLTVIIVAHRTECLKNCDKIIKLDDKKIVYEGNYDGLYNK